MRWAASSIRMLPRGSRIGAAEHGDVVQGLRAMVEELAAERPESPLTFEAFVAALKEEYARRALGDLRNFDIFDFTINGARKE